MEKQQQEQRQEQKQPRLTEEQIVKLRQALEQLEKEFPTEQSIIDEVFRLATQTKACIACGGTTYSFSEEYRKAFCDTCRTEGHYTAGTYFEGAKRLKVYLFTLYLEHRHVAYNANKLHQYFGGSYSTPWSVCLKVGGLTLEGMLQTGHKFAEVISLQFNSVVTKRSKETDARKRPHTEREEELKEFVATADGITSVRPHIHKIFGSTDETDLYEDEQEIYDLLVDGPMRDEEILNKTDKSPARTSAALVTLLICGLIDKLPGDRYQRSLNISGRCFASAEKNPQVFSAVLRAKEYISRVFRGISRRYLQLYLAKSWFALERPSLQKTTLLELSARNNEYIRELKTYVSPMVVRICPL